MSKQSGAKELKLPLSIVTRQDVARIALEFEAVDGTMQQERIRAGDGSAPHVPVMSKGLTETLGLNDYDLLASTDHSDFLHDLRRLKDDAPIIHLTFASEPEIELQQRLTEWARTNLHPQALVTIGLQPGLIGGVVVRTPNRIFDFSIRQYMKDTRSLLAKDLEALLA